MKITSTEGLQKVKEGKSICILCSRVVSLYVKKPPASHYGALPDAGVEEKKLNLDYEEMQLQGKKIPKTKEYSQI